MNKVYQSPVARSTPFENATNNFQANECQTAIEEARAVNPPFKTELWDDFITGTINSSLGWVAVNNATGNFTLAGVTPNSPGVITANVNTGALQPQGSANINLGTNNIQLGGGQTMYSWRISIPVLATTAQDYNLNLGLGNLTAGEYTSGVYFRYSRATSANWLIVSATGGTRTTVITSIPVSTTGYFIVRAIINATGTSVSYFISTNGAAFVLAGTITTNIPITPDIGPAFTLTNTNGTGTKSVLIDYFEFKQVFTTQRYIP